METESTFPVARISSNLTLPARTGTGNRGKRAWLARLSPYDISMNLRCYSRRRRRRCVVSVVVGRLMRILHAWSETASTIAGKTRESDARHVSF